MANHPLSDSLARVRLMAQGHGPMLSGEEREAIGAVLAERDELASAVTDYLAAVDRTDRATRLPLGEAARTMLQSRRDEARTLAHLRSLLAPESEVQR